MNISLKGNIPRLQEVVKGFEAMGYVLKSLTFKGTAVDFNGEVGFFDAGVAAKIEKSQLVIDGDGFIPDSGCQWKVSFDPPSDIQ